MARMTLTIEDAIQDGNAVIKGAFEVKDAPLPIAPGLPAESSPAQIYMTCIQRMWDSGVFNSMLRLAVPDLLFKNEQIKAAKAQMESGGMPLAGAPEAPPAANDADGPPEGTQNVETPVGATPGAAVQDAEFEDLPPDVSKGDLKLVG